MLLSDNAEKNPLLMDTVRFGVTRNSKHGAPLIGNAGIDGIMPRALYLVFFWLPGVLAE